ncbi:MAG: ATP-binding cassette domain-containing protein [Deltaproteobacteria bacterium]|nr:ATP-binding cassette domain-containing protein [Deltaproteobacteria bacterium]
MAALEMIGVKNRFVCPGHFHVDDGDICAIVGPSGSGKTSLLRILVGLDAHEGRVLVDQEEIQMLAPHRRAIGFVSQDLHLFPHLTLEGNLFLAMQRSNLSRSQKHRKARELMGLLRITHLSGRKPGTFSGGEKQRVALARVLASSPRILLLDEPFSKLDFRTVRYLREEFKALQKEVGLTTILVTHDLEEAGDLAKTIWVMRSGSLTASSTPLTLEGDDQNHVDTFLETPNVLSCRILKVFRNGLVQAKWAGGIILIPDEGEPFSHFTIGPGAIEIGMSPPRGPRINRFKGVVGEVETGDDAALVTLDVNRVNVRVEVSREKWHQLGLSPGQKVHGYFRLRALKGYVRYPQS